MLFNRFIVGLSNIPSFPMAVQFPLHHMVALPCRTQYLLLNLLSWSPPACIVYLSSSVKHEIINQSILYILILKTMCLNHRHLNSSGQLVRQLYLLLFRRALTSKVNVVSFSIHALLTVEKNWYNNLKHYNFCK